MAEKKKGTLTLGGTLSVGGGSSNQGGVAVEVRKRRFTPAPTTAGAGASAPVDSEMARRMKVLEQARATAESEQQKRNSERKKVEDLQNLQSQRQEDKKRKEEDQKREAEISAIKKAEEEARKNVENQPANAGFKVKDSRKTLTVGEAFNKKSTGKPAVARDSSKKRGRNAYLGDLEQRYRTMPGRKRGQATRNRDDHENSLPVEKVIKDVEIPDFITVQELASRMAEKGGDVVKTLMLMGEMVTLNQTIDQETAILIVEEFGHNYQTVSEADIEEGLVEAEDNPKDLKPRSPIVTVMGHVDHGKTTLLDTLRKANVVKGEAGGITQHIGAYQVNVPESKRNITFLDTPGHAAFTAMRARGAEVTDIVIVVVAADDGVMPQTKEAIEHAKAAGVPIVIAINKMDKPDANPDRVKNELLSHEVVLEDFGGDIPAVPISALQGDGLKDLEEIILLQADMLDLKANPKRRANGSVVEAQLDKGRGSVATVVVQNGTLKVGDIVVAGQVWGRVRALVSDKGENIKEAEPSVPVEILGLQGVPSAGDAFTVVEDEKKAKEVAEWRAEKIKEKKNASRKLSLDNMFDRMASQGIMELNIIVKADVQGSVEAISHSLKQLNMPQVKVSVLSGGVGVVTETDVTLAMTSGAIISAFNVRADATARKVAEHEGVEIRYYSVIYELIDDVKNAMAGLLEPEFNEEAAGSADVRAIFRHGKSKVAGCMVASGIITRGGKARLVRDGKVAFDGTISSIRREKDDVKEIKSGYECGIMFDKFDDVQEGDVIEAYTLVEIKKTFADLEKLAAIAEKEKPVEVENTEE